MCIECWPSIAELKGKTLHTLAQNKPFDFLELSDHEAIIKVGSSGRLRKIRREEIEGAYQELRHCGEISTRDIQDRHAPRNSAFVSAILAELPDVDHRTRPIRLLHGKATAKVDIASIVKSIVKDILLRRRDVMMLAAQQRAKFEGWLKFELAAALSNQNSVQSVALESQYRTGGKSDLSFEVAETTWYIEMKTANVNWRVDGVENKTRPITKNISEIIGDIAKLRQKCPPSRGLAVFTLFPVPTRIWESERDKLLYHLHRIERESGWVKNTLIHNSEFINLNRQFGAALFVVKVV